MKGADGPPSFVAVEAVQTIAAHDAGFAARARIQIDAEGVLLAGSGGRQRELRLVDTVRSAGGTLLMQGGEARSRAHVLLFAQVLFNQGELNAHECFTPRPSRIVRRTRWRAGRLRAPPRVAVRRIRRRPPP